MQRSQQDQWGWAAASASVDLYYHPAAETTQGSLATRLHSERACNRGAPTGDVLRMLGCLRLQTENAEPFHVVDLEIMAGKPVAARIVWPGGGAHAVVISGVGDAASPLLYVRDPWYGDSYVTHSVFCVSYQGAGRWARTWFTH